MQEAGNEPRTTRTLTDAQRRRFGQLIHEVGFTKACDHIGLSRETGARLIGGLDVQPATLRVAASVIDKLPSPPQRVRASAPEAIGPRPPWLDAWAERYLSDEQQQALERAIAKHAPTWAKR